mgnify:CR=1 FL=1
MLRSDRLILELSATDKAGVIKELTELVEDAPGAVSQGDSTPPAAAGEEAVEPVQTPAGNETREVRLPDIGDSVNAYGYPLGGEELSITEGIVSRIEFVGYSAGTLGLRIQVDAALSALVSRVSGRSRRRR